jgi:hypothetical protein
LSKDITAINLNINKKIILEKKYEKSIDIPKNKKKKTRKLDIVGSDKLGQVSLAHSLAQ